MMGVIELGHASAAWVRAEHASSVAFSILEAKSFKVSRCDSSMLSQGCCLVSSMKGEEHVEVWTQLL